MQSPAGAVQSARFQELCEDIDRFLDPSLASSNASLCDGDSKATAKLSLSKGQAALELQRLSRINEGLKEELEGCQQELARAHLKPTRKGLQEERDQLEIELQAERTKKRRISEMEDELTKLRRERDLLACELQEVREECRQKGSQRSDVAVLEDEKKNSIISSLQSQLLQSLKQSHTPKDDVLKSRVSELEQEVLYLQMLLKESYPEHDLASQLRSKHIDF